MVEMRAVDDAAQPEGQRQGGRGGGMSPRQGMPSQCQETLGSQCSNDRKIESKTISPPPRTASITDRFHLPPSPYTQPAENNDLFSFVQKIEATDITTRPIENERLGKTLFGDSGALRQHRLEEGADGRIRGEIQQDHSPPWNPWFRTIA